MDEATEKRWRDLSEEVLNGMKEWRQAHPTATFREIEEAVHERMSRLEAQMLEGTVLSSKQADWGKEPKETRPRCPTCGSGLQPRGKRKREVQSGGGETIHLERTYGTCPHCGMGLFPPG